MSRLKSFLSLLMVLSLAFYMTGCAPKPTTPPEPTEKTIKIENDVPLIGFGVGTVGGSGGEIVVVSTYTQFYEAVKRNDDSPRIVLVDGTIQWDPSYVDIDPTYSNIINIGSNKTILGLGEGATIDGLTLRIGSSSGSKEQIIMRNLIFDNAPDDNVTIQYTSTLVWIDHCTFKAAADSNVDIIRQSNNITLSWNKFENVGAKGVSIVGSSDTMTADADYLRVTYHHNWFNQTAGRNPRVRFGIIHIFNNLYTGISTGIVSTNAARTLVEKNYFDTVSTPTSITSGTSSEGYIVLSKEDPENGDSNVYVGSGSPVKNLPPTISDIQTWIPYSYSPDDPNNIPSIVQNGAGAGKIIVKYE